jgi:hypothetical protein
MAMAISVALNAPIDRPHYGVFPDDRMSGGSEKGPHFRKAASILIAFHQIRPAPAQVPERSAHQDSG